MQTKKNVSASIISFYRIIVFLMIGIDILKSLGIIHLSDNMFTNIILVLSFALIAYIIFVFIRESIKRDKIAKSILSDVIPRRAIIVDILIHEYYSGKGTDTSRNFNFYPILRDIVTNKLYISLGEYSYGKYRSTCSYFSVLDIFSVKFKLKSSNGNDVNIGDTAIYYMKQEVGKFDINEKYCVFEDIKYYYYGKYEEGKDIKQIEKHLLLNVENDNFLKLLKDITVFEGISDLA